MSPPELCLRLAEPIAARPSHVGLDGRTREALGVEVGDWVLVRRGVCQVALRVGKARAAMVGSSACEAGADAAAQLGGVGEVTVATMPASGRRTRAALFVGEGVGGGRGPRACAPTGGQ